MSVVASTKFVVLVPSGTGFGALCWTLALKRLGTGVVRLLEHCFFGSVSSVVDKD